MRPACGLRLVPLGLALGCALSRNAPVVPDRWPPEPAPAARSASVVVTGERLFEGGAEAWLVAGSPVWADAAARAYRDSGLFSSVTVGVGDADVRASVHVREQADVNPTLHGLSLLTAGLLPIAAGDRFTVRVELRDGAGRILGTFERTERARLWMGLPAVPALAVRSRREAVGVLVYDLNRALLVDARAAGAL